MHIQHTAIASIRQKKKEMESKRTKTSTAATATTTTTPAPVTITDPGAPYFEFLANELLVLIAQMALGGVSTQKGAKGVVDFARARMGTPHTDHPPPPPPSGSVPVPFLNDPEVWKNLDLGEIAFHSHQTMRTAGDYLWELIRIPQARLCTRLTAFEIWHVDAAAVAFSMPNLQFLNMEIDDPMHDGDPAIVPIRPQSRTGTELQNLGLMSRRGFVPAALDRFMSSLATECPHLRELQLRWTRGTQVMTAPPPRPVKFGQLQKFECGHMATLLSVIAGSPSITDLTIPLIRDGAAAPVGMAEILNACHGLQVLNVSVIGNIDRDDTTHDISLVGVRPLEELRELQLMCRRLVGEPGDLARVFPNVKSLRVACVFTPDQLRSVGRMGVLESLDVKFTPNNVSQIDDPSYAAALADIGNTSAKPLKRVVLRQLGMDLSKFFTSRRCFGVLAELSVVDCELPSGSVGRWLGGLVSYTDKFTANAMFTAAVIRNATSLRTLELHMETDEIAATVLSEHNDTVEIVNLYLHHSVAHLPAIHESYPAMRALVVHTTTTHFLPIIRTLPGPILNVQSVARRAYITVPRRRLSPDIRSVFEWVEIEEMLYGKTVLEYIFAEPEECTQAMASARITKAKMVADFEERTAPGPPTPLSAGSVGRVNLRHFEPTEIMAVEEFPSLEGLEDEGSDEDV
jgi:hypothetical protein